MLQNFLLHPQQPSRAQVRRVLLRGDELHFHLPQLARERTSLQKRERKK